jgi:hypothetical protein
MRKTSFAWVLVLVPGAALYACGGGDNTQIDGGNDATVDGMNNPDSTGDSKMNGDTGNDSSMGNDGGSDAPADVVVNVQCRIPADCVDGGNPDAAYPPPANDVCCATVMTGGKGFNCTLDSVTTMCTTASMCPSMLGACPGTDTVRGCAHTSECTEPAYNKCCTVKTDAGAVSACMSMTIAGFLNATCLP